MSWPGTDRSDQTDPPRSTSKKKAREPKFANPEKKSRQRATLPRPTAVVPLPLRPFTSVFGMGTGVTSSLWSPGKMVTVIDRLGSMTPAQRTAKQLHKQDGKKRSSLTAN